MAYETKCQILIVIKKTGWSKLKTMKKNLKIGTQKIRDKTPKTYIDSKEIYVFRFFI